LRSETPDSEGFGNYREQKSIKTYNSGYSLVVTHLTTNPPVRCLSKAERTGSPVLSVLWSYVVILEISQNMYTSFKTAALIIHQIILIASTSSRLIRCAVMPNVSGNTMGLVAMFRCCAVRDLAWWSGALPHGTFSVDQGAAPTPHLSFPS
jgi:hypothetical protein